jgi:hypothetical protein
MQFGVIYLEIRSSTQPYAAFTTLEFHSCFFVFGGIHTAANSFTLHNQCVTLIVIPASDVSHIIAVTAKGPNFLAEESCKHEPKIQNRHEEIPTAA